VADGAARSGASSAAAAPTPSPAPASASAADVAEAAHVHASPDTSDDEREAEADGADGGLPSPADTLLALHPHAQEAILAQHAPLATAIDSALRAAPYAYSLVVLGASLPREFGTSDDAIAAAEPLVRQLADALSVCASGRVSALVVFGPADA
jgi:hypothetical protein